MHCLSMPRVIQHVGCSQLSLTHKPAVSTHSSVTGSGWAGLLASLLLFLPLQVIGIMFYFLFGVLIPGTKKEKRKGGDDLGYLSPRW